MSYMESAVLFIFLISVWILTTDLMAGQTDLIFGDFIFLLANRH